MFNSCISSLFLCFWWSSVWRGYAAGVYVRGCRCHYCRRYNGGFLVININIWCDGLENYANAYKCHKCDFLGFLKIKLKKKSRSALTQFFYKQLKEGLSIWIWEKKIKQKQTSKQYNTIQYNETQFNNCWSIAFAVSLIT